MFDKEYVFAASAATINTDLEQDSRIFFRMSGSTFEQLLNMIGPKMVSGDS